MKPHHLLAFALLSLAACTNSAANKPAATAVANANSTPQNNTARQKEELVKFYTQAIADYINAVYQKDRHSFDTLFFGKHVYGQPDDFPDIELPETIGKTKIRLISPEADNLLMKENKKATYINLISWIDKERAEFSFITFTNRAQHWFDCFIVYKYNTTARAFESQAVRFEVYMYDKAGKLERIAAYQGNKYVGDMPLK